MIEMIEILYPHRMAPVSSGADRVNELLAQILPFRIHRYASGREHNGWRVPDKWEVECAKILKDGKLVWDGGAHPLGVISYADSFLGTVSREELIEHLFSKPDQPDRVVYHW